MIFQLKLDGTMTNIASEPLYQGGNNINTLYCIAPYKSPVALIATFTLPDNTTSAPYPMEYKGTLADAFPSGTLNNLPSGYTENWSVYSLVLQYGVTEQAGTLKCSIIATTDYTVTSTSVTYNTRVNSYNLQMTVQESSLLIPPSTWEEDQWETLISLYSQYITALQSRATALENKVGSDTLQTTASTLTGAVNELHSETTSLDTRLDTAESDIDDLEEKVGTATLAIGSDLSVAVNVLNTNVTNIGTSVATVTATANANKEHIGTLANLNTPTKTDLVTAVNETYNIAINAEHAVTYDNIQLMVASLNGLASTALKAGDIIWIRTRGGVPDLWVSSRESTSVQYTYTTDEAFIAELESGTVQVGYFKVDVLESGIVGENGIAWSDVSVATSAWVSDTSVDNFFYRAFIPLVTDDGLVTASKLPTVTFSALDASTGNFAPIAQTTAGGIYIWAKQIPSATITIKSILITASKSKMDFQLGNFDMVIRTQSEFNDLVTMLNAGTLPSNINSIAFIGSGKRFDSYYALHYDEFYDFTHSGQGLKFPTTVRNIKGFGNPVIKNTAFKTTATLDAEIYWLQKDTGVSTNMFAGYTSSLEGITFCVEPSTTDTLADCGILFGAQHIKNVLAMFNVSSVTYAGGDVYGLKQCEYINECMAIVFGKNSVSNKTLYGFTDCVRINMSTAGVQDNATLSGTSAIGFEGCTMISNCTSEAISDNGTCYGYDTIDYATNCQTDNPSEHALTSKWTGTNTHISADTCDGYSA